MITFPSRLMGCVHVHKTLAVSPAKRLWKLPGPSAITRDRS
ncbi:hypothetical protein OAA19_01195 [Rubripirellula sp.]|nr:hypothetical protein [Rubripirellula sp.]MDB4338703.1 hypothetical protein [Rubripirellula sp.]